MVLIRAYNGRVVPLDGATAARGLACQIRRMASMMHKGNRVFRPPVYWVQEPPQSTDTSLGTPAKLLIPQS